MAIIVSVIGARPQFIKAAPIEMALAASGKVKHYSVHTGQHYDANMSQVFFDELGLEKPYKNLQAGSGTHATQTAAIMTGLEPILMDLKPDMLIVYGDTNSTIAAALVAAKIHIPVAHIEAGLRSFNKSMPEEVNRILTDHVSDLLFAPTQLAIANLEHEGIINAFETGDVMLDMIRIAKQKGNLPKPMQGNYYYATLHRPYNTDQEERLTRILGVLNALKYPVVFSIHPRTKNIMTEKYGLKFEDYSNIKFIDPQGYFENLGWLSHAECLITDSGGMQKEAYFLERQCITVRSETEWVETLENGCNTLVWDNIEDIGEILNKPIGPFINGIYGDGKSAEKIVDCILEFTDKKMRAV